MMEPQETVDLWDAWETFSVNKSEIGTKDAASNLLKNGGRLWVVGAKYMDAKKWVDREQRHTFNPPIEFRISIDVPIGIHNESIALVGKWEPQALHRVVRLARAASMPIVDFTP